MESSDRFELYAQQLQSNSIALDTLERISLLMWRQEAKLNDYKFESTVGFIYTWALVLFFSRTKKWKNNQVVYKISYSHGAVQYVEGVEDETR